MVEDGYIKSGMGSQLVSERGVCHKAGQIVNGHPIFRPRSTQTIPPLPEELVGTHMNRRHMKFPRSIRNRMMNAVARLGVSLGMGKRDISLNTEQTVGSNWISMHSLSVSPMVP